MFMTLHHNQVPLDIAKVFRLKTAHPWPSSSNIKTNFMTKWPEDEKKIIHVINTLYESD